MKNTLWVLALLPLAGCHTVVEAPTDVDRRDIYQRIANALPESSFGWGTPPGIATMSASARAEGPPLEPEALKANEEGFRIRYQVYRVRTAWIPYSALHEVSTSWNVVPNAFFAPLLIVPLQSVRATVVFDANQVPGLITHIKSDIERLESISREIGLGGPWSHAQTVKWKIEDDALLYGQGMLSLHFDFISGVPAWIPYAGKAGRVAEAFAWAKEHPDEPELEAEEPAQKADDTSSPTSRPGE